ncbi:hypothetical protein ACI3KW_13420 [Devosia sp. ZW T5_3]|uniref:hypothetical protein n=1 Tax=Devosia sp. ZW T5_3 TaxID=3378085 RepID=UPI003854BB9D
MRNENIVRDLEVSDGHASLRATYFVERGVLHANIGGKTILLPVGDRGHDESVRQLLIGQLRTRSWRERIADYWRQRRG